MTENKFVIRDSEKQQLNVDHPLTPASNKIPVIIPRQGLLHILMVGGEGRHGIFFHDQSL